MNKPQSRSQERRLAVLPAPKVYIAASYNRKEEIARYVAEIKTFGIEVTSTWTDEPHGAQVLASEVSTAQLLTYAQRDLSEIDRADVLIAFTEPPARKHMVTGDFVSTTNPRGGRHVEFGYAIAKGKELWVIGYLENIFHYLPQVKFFDSWNAVIAEVHGRSVYVVN